VVFAGATHEFEVIAEGFDAAIGPAVSSTSSSRRSGVNVLPKDLPAASANSQLCPRPREMAAARESGRVEGRVMPPYARWLPFAEHPELIGAEQHGRRPA
jgi:hypothetical protein